MKKYMVLCAGMAVALAFTSCGSKESAYRQAYEKAKSEEAALTAQEPGLVVAPVTTTPSTETVVTDNYDNVRVQPDNPKVVDGSGLRTYSVIVGSYRVKATAEEEVRFLRNAGFSSAQIAQSENGLYRVVASTFDDKDSAIRSRNQFRQLKDSYKEAWLLIKQ